MQKVPSFIPAGNKPVRPFCSYRNFYHMETLRDVLAQNSVTHVGTLGANPLVATVLVTLAYTLAFIVKHGTIRANHPNSDTCLLCSFCH